MPSTAGDGGAVAARACHGSGGVKRFVPLASFFGLNRREKASSRIAHKELPQEQQAHAEEVFRTEESFGRLELETAESLSFRKPIASSILQRYLSSEEERRDFAVQKFSEERAESRSKGGGKHCKDGEVGKHRFWQKLKFRSGTGNVAREEGGMMRTEEDEARDVVSQLVSSVGRGRKVEELGRTIVERKEDAVTSSEVPAQFYVSVDYEAIVERLRSGNLEEQVDAAEDVRILAKDDSEARQKLGALGAIPPLVLLLNRAECSHRNSAVLALLNLAIGNNANKEAVLAVDGALTRLVELLEGSDQDVQASVVAALLSLSALDANKPIIGGTGAVPIFVKRLKSGSLQGRKDALGALYNLSLCKTNLSLIVGCGAAAALIAMARDVESRDKAMAVLSSIAGVASGRRAIVSSKEGLPLLIEALRWEEYPKSQERAVFILMVVGHHSHNLRAAMVRDGVVTALLELVLLGSPLAQKRASKLLDSLREDREKGRSISAPMAAGPGSLADPGAIADSEIEIQEVVEVRRSDERRVVDHMVQESLERSMRRIMKRASYPGSGDVHWQRSTFSSAGSTS